MGVAENMPHQLYEIAPRDLLFKTSRNHPCYNIVDGAVTLMPFWN